MSVVLVMREKTGRAPIFLLQISLLTNSCNETKLGSQLADEQQKLYVSEVLNQSKL